MADAVNHTHTPYNFVPFSNKILSSAPDTETLLEEAGHDKIRPERLTGEIRVTLEAETPIFVSNGTREADKTLRFFRDAQGRFCIPSSTVRGLLRQNMKILSYGVIRQGEDVENQRLYFREMASSGHSVRAELKEYYRNTLGIQSYKTPESGKAYSVPEKVECGYLENRGGKYWITPTATKAYRVSRKHEGVQRWGERFAQTVPVAYRALDDKRVSEIVPLAEKRPDMLAGDLLYTGHWVGREPNHLYLFPRELREEDAFPVDNEDILSYREDFENRKNSLEGNTWHILYNTDFWNLPKDGERKPVFYIRHEGRLFFGMSLFLRIGFRWSVADGLPQKQREAADSGVLDYTDALLGFARKENAYASRVSVGDFHALGTPSECPKASMILGNPKPGYYPGYLKDGRNYNDCKDDKQGNALEPGFQLRGHKQYWLKPVETTAAGKNENMNNPFRPLAAGTKFQGVIRYENLTREELGLLIWSVRLKRDSAAPEEYRQSIGMGKPYGYGRIKVTLDAVLTFDLDAMYRPEGLFAVPNELDPGTIDAYVAAYDKRAADALSKLQNGKKKGKSKRSLLDFPEIQDFLRMKRLIADGNEFSYMGLKEYQNVRTSLPTAKELCDKLEASQTPQAPPDWEALRNKFKPL